MNALFYSGSMVVLWFINLLNGSGIGKAYKTTELASTVVLLIAIGCMAIQLWKDGDFLIPRKYFFTVLPMAVIFVTVSLLNNRMLAGLEGFWVYLLVYVLSKTKPTEHALRLTAIFHGALGLILLFIYDYMSVLSGWNANSIAIIGLFSFLIFVIPFFGVKDWRGIVTLPVVGAAYIFLILPTDSRSCSIVVILTLLLVLRVLPVKRILRSSAWLFTVLLVPLFVAIFVCLFSSFADISGLAQWSQETFGKELFSGRDTIWITGFQVLAQAPLFGSGLIASGYWHNSAIACLTAFGSVGYLIWIKLFHAIICEGRRYIYDACVAGSMTAFLMLSCQQSVELGIFAPDPSLLPYVMLGILLGRVNYLRSQKKCLK